MVETLQMQDSRLIFSSTLHDASAYLASVTADLIRTELISRKQSFTFETERPGDTALCRGVR